MLFELMKIGEFNGHKITKELFAALEESFPGRAPVVLGHDVTMWAMDNAPAIGIVESVTSWEDLFGGAIVFNKDGQEAWDSKKYPNWSIGIRGEIKHIGTEHEKVVPVVDHVALLGAYAPGFPNLQVHFTQNDNNKYMYSNRELNVMGGVPDKPKTEEKTVADNKTPESTAPAAIDYEAQFKAQEAKIKAMEKTMSDREAQFRAEKVEAAKLNFSSAALKLFPKDAVEKAIEDLPESIDPEALAVFSSLLEAKLIKTLPSTKRADFRAKSGEEIPVYSRKGDNKSGYGGLL